VLQHIAAGHTDRETASELDVSVSSVRNAVRAAIAHLSTRNRPEAIFKAVSAGYIAMVTGPRAVDAGPRKVPPRLP
jgi:DNA-binding NarL/FixJ family response regulator